MSWDVNRYIYLSKDNRKFCPIISHKWARKKDLRCLRSFAVNFEYLFDLHALEFQPDEEVDRALNFGRVRMALARSAEELEGTECIVPLAAVFPSVNAAGFFDNALDFVGVARAWHATGVEHEDALSFAQMGFDVVDQRLSEMPGVNAGRDADDGVLRQILRLFLCDVEDVDIVLSHRNRIHELARVAVVRRIN